METLAAGELLCGRCKKQQNAEVLLHHLRPGTVLQRKYLVGRALGEGGFGITYVGRDLTLDMRIAIKEYFPGGFAVRQNNEVTLSGNSFRISFEKEMERFLREARSLAKLSDEEGIVNVRDFFQENGTAYIVMEYLDGMTLKQYLQKRGVIPAGTIIRMLAPVMQALHRVHERSLIHRDISPDNIMLLRSGKLKVLDFGSAREVQGDKSLSVVLKHGYAPIEQYSSKGVQGPWVDVYALCATIYKSITGITPDTATERVIQDTLRLPSRMGVQISPQQEAALMRGLSVRAQDRFRSMAELYSAFGLGSLEQSAPPAEDREAQSAKRALEEREAERYLMPNYFKADDLSAGSRPQPQPQPQYRPQPQPQPRPQYRPQPQPQYRPQPQKAAAEKPKKKKRGLMIGLIAAMVILAAVAAAVILWPSEPAEPDAAAIRRDVQSHVEQTLGQSAVVSAFEVLQTEREGKYLDVTCLAYYGVGDEETKGTFTLSYTLKDDEWELYRCTVEEAGTSLAPLPSEEEPKDEPEDKPEEAPAEPVTMSDDWKDFTFEMDGHMYQLPMAYSEFVKNGWRIYETESVDEDMRIAAYDKEYVQLTNGAVKIWVYLINQSGNIKTAKDCNIGRVEISASHNLNLKLAGGITLMSTVEEIEEVYGKASSVSVYDGYTYLAYQDGDSYDVKMQFAIYQDTSNNSVDLQNIVATEADKTEISKERPAYLADYKAPTTLSDNPAQTQFLLDGKLYQLPCPLDEFTEEGWTVTRSMVTSLGAMNYDSYSLVLTKGDRKIDVGLANFSDKEVYSENCAVYRVTFSDSYLKNISEDYLNLPAGLSLFSSLEEIGEACTDFELYQGTSYTRYTYTTQDDRYNTLVYLTYSWWHDGERYITISSLEWNY